MDTIILENHLLAVQAEEYLLGSILIVSIDGSRQEINEVRRIVKPEHFTDYERYDNIRSRAYAAMLGCKDAPHQVNVARQLQITNRYRQGDINQMTRWIASPEFNSYEYLSFAQAILVYASKRNPQLATSGFKGVQL